MLSVLPSGAEAPQKYKPPLQSRWYWIAQNSLTVIYVGFWLVHRAYIDPQAATAHYLNKKQTIEMYYNDTWWSYWTHIFPTEFSWRYWCTYAVKILKFNVTCLKLVSQINGLFSVTWFSSASQVHSTCIWHRYKLWNSQALKCSWTSSSPAFSWWSKWQLQNW